MSIAAACLLIAACSSPNNSEPAHIASAEAGDLVPQSPVTSARLLWRERVAQPYGTGPSDVAKFGAANGVVGILFQRSIPVLSFYQLEEHAAGRSGEELRRWPGDTRATISTQVSLVHISDSGAIWLLDSANHRIVSQNIGGGRAVMGIVGSDEMRKGFCLPNDSTIVAMASSGVGQVSSRTLAGNGEPTSRPLGFRSPIDSVTWALARFVTGPARACLVAVQGQGRLFTITEDSVIALWKTTARIGIRRSSGWRLALERVFKKPNPVDSLVMIDAASNQQSLAVLVGSNRGPVGRDVHLFDAKGAAVAIMSIQENALHIAMTATDLLALELRRDSLFLAAYELPPDARAPVSPRMRTVPSAPERHPRTQ